MKAKLQIKPVGWSLLLSGITSLTKLLQRKKAPEDNLVQPNSSLQQIVNVASTLRIRNICHLWGSCRLF